jgi:hypothetical protein
MKISDERIVELSNLLAQRQNSIQEIESVDVIEAAKQILAAHEEATPPPWLPTKGDIMLSSGLAADVRATGLGTESKWEQDVVFITTARNYAPLVAQELLSQSETIDALTRACNVALDALGCDRLRQDRLEAQRIIKAAVELVK